MQQLLLLSFFFFFGGGGGDNQHFILSSFSFTIKVRSAAIFGLPSFCLVLQAFTKLPFRRVTVGYPLKEYWLTGCKTPSHLSLEDKLTYIFKQKCTHKHACTLSFRHTEKLLLQFYQLTINFHNRSLKLCSARPTHISTVHSIQTSRGSQPPLLFPSRTKKGVEMHE